jgi:hypothetical protein
MRYLAVFLLLVLSACSLFGPSGPSYVVFFQERSAQLDAPARRVVAQAAQRTNADPAARVEVSGYTDSAGSPQADVLLSQQRAQAVADALVASGVAADRLVRKGQGQTGGNPALQADVSRLRSATSATSATSEDYGPARLAGSRRISNDAMAPISELIGSYHSWHSWYTARNFLALPSALPAHKRLAFTRPLPEWLLIASESSDEELRGCGFGFEVHCWQLPCWPCQLRQKRSR